MRRQEHTSAFQLSLDAFMPRRPDVIAILAVVLGLLQMLVNPAGAGTITEAQKKEIANAVAAYEEAVTKADYETALKLSLSSKLIAAIGKQFGVAEGDLNREVIGKMAKLMASAPIEKYSMDVVAAQYRQDANGQPFALIPTSLVMFIRNDRVISRNHALAIYEESKWWLIRISEKQLPLLREVYPEFSEIDFPKESVEIKKNER